MTPYEQWQQEKYGNVLPDSEPPLENDTSIILPTGLLYEFDKEENVLIIQDLNR